MICKRLEGRSVIVTGGASGVGRATAKRFAEEGATTVCLFDLHAENLHRVAGEGDRPAKPVEGVILHRVSGGGGAARSCAP